MRGPSEWDARIEDLEQFGGARAIIKQVEELLRLDAVTVTGRSWREEPADFEVPGGSIIRSLNDPI